MTSADEETADGEPTLATVVPLPLPDRGPDPDTDPGRPPYRPAPRTSSSVLMAAMLGLADAMGFERPRTELVTMEQASSGEGDGDAVIIGFGPLDPLD